MEKAKKLSEVTLGNSTFNKNVRLHQKGEIVGGVAVQKVELTPKSEHMLQFGYNDQSILEVDENDGKYTLRIPGMQLLKDRDGNLFPGLGENGELLLDPETASITMSHNTEELRFEIKAQDDRKYIINTGAYGVRIQVEDSSGNITDYNFRIPPIKENDSASGVGITMHPKLMEEFLNPDKKLCKFFYPKTNKYQTTMQSSPEKSLSVDLFAAFVETMDPGTTLDFLGEKGNGYYISLLPNQGTELNPDGKHRPPAFITQIRDGKRSNFLFVNGHFRHCDNYRLMTTEGKDGTLHPMIVLETGTATPHVHYKYELPVDKEGNLTSDAMAILDQVRSIYGGPAVNTPSSNQERKKANKYKIEETVEGKTKSSTLYFEPADSRNADALKDYDIRRLADEVYNDEDPEQEPSSEPPQVTDDGNEDGSENTDGNGGGGGGDGRPGQDGRDGHDGHYGQDGQEGKKGKDGTSAEAEAPDPGPAPGNDTVFDISQPVEAVSETLCAVGVFLLLGAILTGGLTLIAGFVVGAIGFAGVITADHYKFRPLKHAQKKVKQLKQQEEEDEQEVGKQNENEQSVDKADEAATQSEKKLNQEIKSEFSGEATLKKTESSEEATLDTIEADELQAQQNLSNELGQQSGFASLYEKYGILPTAEGQKVDTLTSYDGLDARRQMLAQLSAIQSASPVERAQRVEDFITSTFYPIPQEERKQLTEGEGIFSTTDEGRAKFGTFLSALRESVALGEKKEELLEQQKKFVSTARDSTLEKFMTSSDLTPEQRAARFKRYAEIVVRRFSNDPNLTEERLSRLISKLPEEERVACGEILAQANVKIETQLTAVEELARTNAEHSSQLTQVEALAHAIDAAQKHEGFVSRETLETDARDYMQHSLYSYYGNKADLKALSTLREGATAETKTPQEKAAMDAMSLLINGDRAKDVGTTYGEVTQILFGGNYAKLLTDAYLHPDVLTGVPGFPAAGKRFQVDGRTIGTEDEMLGQLVEFVTSSTSEGPASPADINLRNKFKQYQLAVSVCESAYRSQLYDVIDKVFEVKIDPAWRKFPINSQNVQQEIEALTKTYGKKFTELENPSAIYTSMSVQERIARISLAAQALNSDCPQHVRDIFTQFTKTFDFVLSGQFAHAQMEEAIRATSGDTFTDKRLGDTEKKLQGDIATYKDTFELVSTLPAGLQNKILATYNALLQGYGEGELQGVSPKQAMVQAIKQEFDAMEFEGKDKFAPLIEGLSQPTPEAGAVEKVDALLGTQREVIETRGKTQRSIFRESLGRESVDSVYTSTFENKTPRKRQPKVAKLGLTKKEQRQIESKENELKEFNAQSPIIEDFVNLARSGDFRRLEKLLTEKRNFNETLSNDEAVIVNPDVCRKYLEQIGLNPSTLKHILKLPADQRSVEFEKLCKGAHISEKLGAIKTNIELELQILKVEPNVTKRDRKRARKLIKSSGRLSDIDTLTSGIDQIRNTKYVDEQTWIDFALNNAALLERLGISPKTLTDPKKRDKNLAKLAKQLKKMQKKATKQYKKEADKQDKEARNPSADLSKRSSANIRSSLHVTGSMLEHVNSHNRTRDAERQAQQAQQEAEATQEAEAGRETGAPETERDKPETEQSKPETEQGNPAPEEEHENPDSEEEADM